MTRLRALSLRLAHHRPRKVIWRMLRRAVGGCYNHQHDHSRQERLKWSTKSYHTSSCPGKGPNQEPTQQDLFQDCCSTFPSQARPPFYRGPCLGLGLTIPAPSSCLCENGEIVSEKENGFRRVSARRLRRPGSRVGCATRLRLYSSTTTETFPLYMFHASCGRAAFGFGFQRDWNGIWDWIWSFCG